MQSSTNNKLRSRPKNQPEASAVTTIHASQEDGPPRPNAGTVRSISHATQSQKGRQLFYCAILAILPPLVFIVVFVFL